MVTVTGPLNCPLLVSLLEGFDPLLDELSLLRIVEEDIMVGAAKEGLKVNERMRIADKSGFSIVEGGIEDWVGKCCSAGEQETCSWPR